MVTLAGVVPLTKSPPNRVEGEAPKSMPEESGIYHALISNVELADKFSVSPVTKNVQDRRSGSGRGKLMLVRPAIRVPDNVS